MYAVSTIVTVGEASGTGHVNAAGTAVQEKVVKSSTASAGRPNAATLAHMPLRADCQRETHFQAEVFSKKGHAPSGLQTALQGPEPT